MKLTAKEEARRARLIALCELFAGDRWQSAVSRASGLNGSPRVPQSTLAMIVKGDRLLTAEVERAVALGIIDGADEMVAKAKVAKAAAKDFLKLIEKE